MKITTELEKTWTTPTAGFISYAVEAVIPEITGKTIHLQGGIAIVKAITTPTWTDARSINYMAFAVMPGTPTVEPDSLLDYPVIASTPLVKTTSLNATYGRVHEFDTQPMSILVPDHGYVAGGAVALVLMANLGTNFTGDLTVAVDLLLEFELVTTSKAVQSALITDL